MSAVHARAFPEAGDFNPACIIGTICKQPGVDGRPVTAVTNKVLEEKFRCYEAQIEESEGA